MKTTIRSLLAALLLVSVTPALAKPADPPLVIGPLHLTAPGQPDVALQPNGEVVTGGKVVAKIVGADVKDVSGKVLLHVDDAGLVTGSSVNRKVQITSKGEIVSEDGTKLTLGSDGKLSSGKGDASGVRVTGATAATQRTALMLLLLALAPTSTTTKPVVK